MPAGPDAVSLEPLARRAARARNPLVAELDELLIAAAPWDGGTRCAEAPARHEVLADCSGEQLSITEEELELRSARSSRASSGGRGGQPGLIPRAQRRGARCVPRAPAPGPDPGNLARRALGTPQGQEVNGEKQEMWLGRCASSAARSSRPAVSRGDRGALWRPAGYGQGFPGVLHILLPPTTFADCFQLLLQKRVRARMPTSRPRRGQGDRDRLDPAAANRGRSALTRPDLRAGHGRAGPGGLPAPGSGGW